MALPGAVLKRGRRRRAALMWVPEQTVLAAGGTLCRPAICVSPLPVAGNGLLRTEAKCPPERADLHPAESNRK